MDTYHMEICDDYCEQFEAVSEVAAIECFRDTLHKHSAQPYGFLFAGPILSGQKPIAWYPGSVTELGVAQQPGRRVQ